MIFQKLVVGVLVCQIPTKVSIIQTINYDFHLLYLLNLKGASLFLF